MRRAGSAAVQSQASDFGVSLKPTNSHPTRGASRERTRISAQLGFVDAETSRINPHAGPSTRVGSIARVAAHHLVNRCDGPGRGDHSLRAVARATGASHA